MLLHLRKKRFAEYEHGMYTLVEYGYVIGRYFYCEMAVEHYTSFRRSESKKTRLRKRAEQ